MRRASISVIARGLVATTFATATLTIVAGGTVAAASALDHRLDLVVSDVVYDSGRNVLYASVHESDAQRANTIVTINVETGAILDSHSVGTQPGQLALSADGSSIFVGVDGQGTVKKLALPAFSESWSFTFGSASGRTMLAGDIAVIPGSNDAIAVSRRVNGLSPDLMGIVIVDGGTARTNSTPDHIGSNSIAFNSNGVELYGSDTGSSANRFYRHSVDVNGVAITQTTNDLGGEKITFHDGLVYVADGKILNVTTPTTTVADTLSGGSAVAIDAALNRVYYFDRGTGSDADAIVGFDITSRSQVGRWDLLNHEGFATELISMGNQRLAYIDADHPVRRYGTLVLVDLAQPGVGPTDSRGEYTPLTPDRILDTRSGLGRNGNTARLGAGQTIDVVVAGVGGVPASGADTVVLNVAVVGPTQPGFLTVYPAGVTRPTISSLNFTAGNTVANLVTMPLGAGGRVSVYNPFGEVDVLFDVAGYYAEATGTPGSRIHPVNPRRAMDTRDGTGGWPGAIGGGQTARLQIAGLGDVPSSGVTAVALNVTVTESTSPSFVTVFPSDVSQPTVSNLNFAGGATLANQVIVRLPANGSVDIFNAAGAAHVIVDVVGYYDGVEDGERGRFMSLPPYRATDTRENSPFPAPGNLDSGDLLFYNDTQAYSAIVINVTVTDTTGYGFVTAFPYLDSSSVAPLASTLNYAPGRTVPNHAMVATGPYVGFYNFGGGIHLIVDAYGAFT